MPAKGGSASGGKALTLKNIKMPCIYVLRSRVTGKHYTGSSREDDSVKRLQQHNSGKTKSIKSGIPWILVYEEKYSTYTEARKREIFLKSGIGRKFLKEKLSH